MGRNGASRVDGAHVGVEEDLLAALQEGGLDEASGAMPDWQRILGAMNLELGSVVREEKLKWYCVRSQPKHEHVAAASLRRRLKLEVIHPQIRFRRATARGPPWVTESTFPNYLFARFNRERSQPEVHYASGVAGIVHFGDSWPTVPDAVIEDLRNHIGEDGMRVLQDEPQTGDEIEIAGGAFHGLTAVVCRLMPAKSRVAILLDFLGRQTMTEIDIGAVVRMSPRFLDE